MQQAEGDIVRILPPVPCVKSLKPRLIGMGGSGNMAMRAGSSLLVNDGFIGMVLMTETQTQFGSFPDTQ